MRVAFASRDLERCGHFQLILPLPRGRGLEGFSPFGNRQVPYFHQQYCHVQGIRQ